MQNEKQGKIRDRGMKIDGMAAFISDWIFLRFAIFNLQLAISPNPED
jgi:hypothetical protein